ncbi:MAG: DNA internalization-related competence protein ComEC/Rec2 [Vicinamibacterales bacterium]
MLIIGATLALWLPSGTMPWFAAGAVALWQLALVAFVAARGLLFVAAALASIALSAAASAQQTDWDRRHAPVLMLAASPAGAHPVVIEGVLLADASLRAEGGTTLHLRVERAVARAGAMDALGGVMLSVAGAPDPAVVREWTRGRRIRAPALLRRPTRYLNDGVGDAERALMRRGIALVGTVKSAALVEVLAPASALDEALARARAASRGAIAEALASDPIAGAVVTAILIGDRAGLSDDIERRMQRAGTYHVIAISGGNIALFAMLAWGACRLLLRSRRAALCGAMLMIGGYGLLVGTGASVGRAVAAALLFLVTSLAGHRAPPLNVIAMVGAAFLLWDPLAIVDLGFLLSFGATAGILLAVPGWTSAIKSKLGSLPAGSMEIRAATVVAGMIAATIAAEIALLPVQAAAFQRLTAAGLLLNLIAIPAMALTQVAGMALIVCAACDAAAALHGASVVARFAARALVDSASLVDLLPMLTWRVASPADWLVATYIAACGLLAWGCRPRARGAAAAVALAAGIAMAMSITARAPPAGLLRVSVFDVGQAEAILLRLPSGRSVLVDAAGTAGRFDIGDRVLVPALLGRGVTRLDWLVLTHADIDHAGGAMTVLADLAPSRVLEGVSPPRHLERNRLAHAAAASGASVESLRAGGGLLVDGVLLKVLHPPEPDWERQDVRNDDSVVLDVRFGAVSILLTGDAGEPVESAIASRFAPAPLRILKVGHHGSRTSTSQMLLDAVRPAAALISAGRGNFYGHPSPVVLERLRRAGVETFRTDRDGQIDVTTDGRTVEIMTFTGRKWGITAR